MPADVAEAETRDTRAECDARDVGVDPQAIENIWASVLSWYASGIHPAISVCLRVRGQVVLSRCVGYARGAGPSDPPDAPRVRVTPKTPFNIFSASKPMAAMVIHLLDQRHQLHLDDPVCEYVPEFGCHGKEWITIRHVLTHRAGIPTLPESAMDLSYIEDINNKRAVELLCETVPVSRPGGRLAYHAITGGFLLGEIVRRVTGKNIRHVVEEELARPLGWRWMSYGVRRRDIDKVALNYFTGLPLVPPIGALVQRILGMDFVEVVRSSNDERFLTGVLPAANLIATADELSEFYQLLMNGGELRGVRVFDPRTVWRATSEQSYGELDFTLGIPLRYGMGFMLGGEWFSLYGLDTAHAFGHLGFTNIVGWADPARHLAGAIMTSGKPVLYPELYRALALLHAIATACPKDDSVPPFGRPERPPRRRQTGKRDEAERSTGSTKAAARSRNGKAGRKRAAVKERPHKKTSRKRSR